MGEVKTLAIVIFVVIVALVLFVSFFTARKARSAHGYYAAGGRIHWGVNGIAFAGDYLSAASFLGICGMIAVSGYDGFLYSIGYLAGWVVALFVVAEPLRRLGRYTFTDGLDAKFNKRSVKLMAAIATLVVSIFYLIPQMVGAGVLIEPLLGFPHWVGVVLVGAIVITIVATAGMTSTTYVQFIKGSLLIVFALVIVIALTVRGLSTEPDQGGRVPFYNYKTITATQTDGAITPNDPAYQVVGQHDVKVKDKTLTFVKIKSGDITTWWKLDSDSAGVTLHETQQLVTQEDGTKLVNGAPESADNKLRLVGNVSSIAGEMDTTTGPVNPFKFLSLIGDPDTTINLWKTVKFTEGTDNVSVFYSVPVAGDTVVKPGQQFKVAGSWVDRVDFVSLMIALFLGTAALPHILIRYYTVPSQRAARKSTVVAIAAIGFFYILTLFLGLGAMTSSTVNVLDNNMSAPLLAESFGTFLFAMISAIAFATVLGTVSGLIIAASGAVAHDLMDRFGGLIKNERQKVLAGRVAAFVVGAIAILLGIAFQGVNVSFLVGLAFAVAASANLPCIIMMLFWKRTTSKGMVASMIVGIVSSVGIILFSPTAWELYGLVATDAPIQMKNPGIISIPLSFVVIYVVSKLTKPDMMSDQAFADSRANPAPQPAVAEAAPAE
ncbi:MAG: cation acetate symporter [Actinobacteria bacterium RBG_16_64_13]|nr:MAG: cation acetate symporter [Actinobacteria bacterium RBG_16_64_13]